MKGNELIIQALNDNLRDELTAINQYIVHAELCENWGYEKLHDYIRGRSIQEMKHAEAIIARILFLEGIPVVSELNPLHIGKDVKAMMESDCEAEKVAVAAYNDAVKLAGDLKDNGTKDLFESNLKDEEAHLDWLEAQLDQIAQMGIQNYLALQAKG